MPQGTFSEPSYVIGFIQADSIAAVTAGQVLRLWGGAPISCNIGGIQANARIAGSGTGNTVLDIQKNGVSIWPQNTGSRPTLAAASTGAFALQIPDTINIKQGDTVDLIVVSIPTVAGHQKVSFIITLERPHGAFMGYG